MAKSVYQAFGLNMESEVPFLDMPTVPGPADIVIRYGSVPDEIPGAKSKGVRYQASPGEFLLQVDGIARYYVTQGTAIQIERAPGAADEEVVLFLMGSAMGALLHQRHILPLHASAVAVDGDAVLFLGTSSVGKSTLAAGLQKRRHPLLADDVCAVTADGDGEAKVIPGFPRLKLWADALEKLEADAAGLKRVRLARDFKKYFVPFDGESSTHAAIRSIFVLGTTNTDRFEIVELKGTEKLGPIIRNTYRPRFLEGLGGKEDHFRQCSAVVAAATVLRVVRPGGEFRLDELMDLIEEHW